MRAKSVLESWGWVVAEVATQLFLRFFSVNLVTEKKFITFVAYMRGINNIGIYVHFSTHRCTIQVVDRRCCFNL